MMSGTLALQASPEAEHAMGKKESRFSQAVSKADSFFQRQSVSMEVNVYSLLALRLHQTAISEDKWARLPNLLHAFLVYSISVSIQFFLLAFLLLAAEQLETETENSFYLNSFNVSSWEGRDLIREVSRLPSISKETLNNSQAAEMLKQAASNLNLYPTHPHKLVQQCESQLHTVQLQAVYYVVVLFWIMFMMAEMKQATWELIHIMGIPIPEKHDDTYNSLTNEETDCSTSTADPMIQKSQKRETLRAVPSTEIDSMGRGLKVTLAIMISVIRLFTASTVLYAGSKYLLLQTNMVHIVVKAVSIKFVLEVDDLLLSSLATHYAKHAVQTARYKTEWGMPPEDSLWEQGLGGFLYACCACVFVLGIIQGIFGHLMDFREACNELQMTHGLEGIGHHITLTELALELLK